MTDEKQSDQENTQEKGASVKFPPPLVFLIVIAIAYGLEKFLNLTVWGVENTYIQAASAFLFVAGLIPLVTAAKLFKKQGQNPKPWLPTPEIIVEGIYSYSRNPMYLGMALLQSSIGIYLESIVAVLTVPFSLLLVFHIAVKNEEIYLESKFGDSYMRYRSEVRRWI
jgi:protein-S-isoprenylcysteine O-methyltransferase Ste14